jgi:hypothetical protein
VRRRSASQKWEDTFWRVNWAKWPACYVGLCEMAAVVKVPGRKLMDFRCWEHRGDEWTWLEPPDLRF